MSDFGLAKLFSWGMFFFSVQLLSPIYDRAWRVSKLLDGEGLKLPKYHQTVACVLLIDNKQSLKQMVTNLSSLPQNMLHVY